jgi:hypothetical protein
MCSMTRCDWSGFNPVSTRPSFSCTNDVNLIPGVEEFQSALGAAFFLTPLTASTMKVVGVFRFNLHSTRPSFSLYKKLRERRANKVSIRFQRGLHSHTENSEVKQTEEEFQSAFNAAFILTNPRKAEKTQIQTVSIRFQRGLRSHPCIFARYAQSHLCFNPL